MNTYQKIDEYISGAAIYMSSLRDLLETLVDEYEEHKIAYYDTEKHECAKREECVKQMEVLRQHIIRIYDFVISQKEEEFNLHRTERYIL